jgi:hypothetical protein
MLAGGTIASIIFAIFILAAAMFGLAASGHFPREFRSPRFNSAKGATSLWTSIVLAGAAFVFGTAAAIFHLPWYVLIIAAGAAILIAPLVLATFPDPIVNGHATLIVLSTLTVFLGGLLYFL